MFGIISTPGPWELILILILALIIFGPGKLPEVGRAIGKSLREFRKASREVTEKISEELEDKEKAGEK
ncbi:twin-arginine translocase TatA/TatE family subunit [Calderihabitans maritimus]|uniref:Sec-independent protein translocase protein TatA n=1 Tax=Calderihabitans maritimus TaxID=1246530 RepID=A0A1Z5HP95_9FIRM|nr:twin-arginine translocase TatA/TatE family subunit [Calderihabitans maritimus]GAW91125.1 twin-arginine translocation protein TatA [Calderihabitans maritimus]